MTDDPTTDLPHDPTIGLPSVAASAPVCPAAPAGSTMAAAGLGSLAVVLADRPPAPETGPIDPGRWARLAELLVGPAPAETEAVPSETVAAERNDRKHDGRHDEVGREAVERVPGEPDPEPNQSDPEPEASPAGAIAHVVDNLSAWTQPLRRNRLTGAVERCGRPFGAQDIRETWHQFCRRGVNASRQDVADAVAIVADDHGYNPLVDWLDALPPGPADGEGRIDTFFETYLPPVPVGEEDDRAYHAEYHRLLARAWFVQMVERAYRPGCPINVVPVLLSAYWPKTVVALESLIGAEWLLHSAYTLQGLGQRLPGKWLTLLPPPRSRAYVDRLGAFVGGKSDWLRNETGRRVEIDRGCGFAVVADPGEIGAWWTSPFFPMLLADPRRIDPARLAADRELLWAEARDLYLNGEDSSVLPADIDWVAAFGQYRHIAKLVDEWLALGRIDGRANGFTVEEMNLDAGALTLRQIETAAGPALRRRGYTNRRVHHGRDNHHMRWYWQGTESESEEQRRTAAEGEAEEQRRTAAEGEAEEQRRAAEEQARSEGRSRVNAALAAQKGEREANAERVAAGIEAARQVRWKRPPLKRPPRARGTQKD
jgi:hypothetical protein